MTFLLKLGTSASSLCLIADIVDEVDWKIIMIVRIIRVV